MLLLVQDRDRIAGGMNDLVVHRLFAAGLALEMALGLMGDHPGAGEVQEAIGELDLAIRDVRNVVFDHHQPDPPSGERVSHGPPPGYGRKELVTHADPGLAPWPPPGA
jgi:hypothetical protein